MWFTNTNNVQFLNVLCQLEAEKMLLKHQTTELKTIKLQRNETSQYFLALCDRLSGSSATSFPTFFSHFSIDLPSSHSNTLLFHNSFLFHSLWQLPIFIMLSLGFICNLCNTHTTHTLYDVLLSVISLTIISWCF